MPKNAVAKSETPDNLFSMEEEDFLHLPCSVPTKPGSALDPAIMLSPCSLQCMKRFRRRAIIQGDPLAIARSSHQHAQHRHHTHHQAPPHLGPPTRSTRRLYTRLNKVGSAQHLHLLRSAHVVILQHLCTRYRLRENRHRILQTRRARRSGTSGKRNAQRKVVDVTAFRIFRVGGSVGVAVI